MRDVVELRDDVVPVLRTNISVRLVHLRAKVAEDNHRGLVGSEEDGADEQFEVLERVFVIIRVELDDDHVRYIRDMMAVAVTKVI